MEGSSGSQSGNENGKSQAGKFRSHASEKMDRWKSKGGKSQRRERQKKEDRSEKVEKSRNKVFFQCFVALEGRKVGSLKRRVRSHLGRWEMKNCTPPLWRESKFWSQNAQDNFSVGALLEVAMSKKRMPLWREASKGQKQLSIGLLEVVMLKKRTTLWREAHVEVKMQKQHSVGKLSEEELFKKCRPLWREARFEVKMCKAHHVGNTCGDEMLRKSTLLWREAHFEVKSAQNWRSRSTSGRWDIGKVHASTTATTTTLRHTTLQLPTPTTNNSSLQLTITTTSYK